MHDLLLKKSPTLDRNSLIQYAKVLGLDMKKFIVSIDAKRHKEEIEGDLKLAISLDLYNTPTFFINGRKIVGNVPYEYLKKAVEEELKNAKK